MASRPPRVGIVGTFDVENFGDLLFPLIARHELESRVPDVELVPYSYHARDSGSWPYDVLSLARLGDDVQDLDLLLVGGGHLIRFDKTVAYGYAPPGRELHHPTAYGLMPTLLAGWTGVPVAWNAVGVSSGTPLWAQPLLAEAVQATSYTAVRDEPSAAEIRRLAPDAGVAVVPDTAFGLGAVRSSSSEAREAMVELGLSGRYVVYQPSPDFAPYRPWLVDALRFYAAQGVTIVELPVSPCLGDVVGAVDVETPTRSPLRWPSPLALAGLVAGAEAVIARSLHVSIAAVTAGVPVVRRESEPESKYRVLDELAGVHVVTDDAQASEPLPLGRREVGEDVAELLRALDRHWTEIAALVGEHPPSRTGTLAATIGRLTHLEEATQGDTPSRDLERAFSELDLERARGSFAHRTITGLEERLQATESELHATTEQLRDAKQGLDDLESTVSWRVTRPLRIVRAALRRPSAARAAPGDLAGAGMSPPLEGDPTPPSGDAEPSTDAAPPSAEAAASVVAPAPEDDEPVVHVELLTNPVDLPTSSARKVAFYLPQFHPIEENDDWWGRGFTEWTNVTKAQPLFVGHPQPNRPGELGYYDLRVVDVQRRQVELARLYGIDAFCFHFYWFGGRRLLERPLEQYVADPTLDLPFCLCWANESWTRRWDGRESDILLAQQHSEADDVAFIDYVTRYLDDPRYVRVDGRPLLVIYRPGLLPDAPATVARWRDRYRETRGGELCVAHAMAFDDLDPEVYGCDASIEFPPVRLGPTAPPTPPRIEEGIIPLSDEGAYVFDGRFFVEESRRYTAPDRLLFRGVCPTWDNSPRRGSAAYVLWRTSPAGFQTWLRNALVETEDRLPPEQQLVFVNAWNEWGESCYLEPDERLGYAYLEAVRVASVRTAARPRPAQGAPELGAVVHAVDADELTEVIDRLERLDGPPALLVTTGASQATEIERSLQRSPLGSHVVTVESGEGDFLTFLDALASQSASRDVILNLHTCSPGSVDEGRWRSEALDDMLDADLVRDLLEAFERDPQLGLVGPLVSRLPVWKLSGPEADRVGALAHRLGAFRDDVMRASYFASTMFYVRPAALAPLRAIAIDRANRTGDRPDVALAAARCVELSAYAAGYRVEDTVSFRLPNVSTSRSTSATRRG